MTINGYCYGRTSCYPRNQPCCPARTMQRPSSVVMRCTKGESFRMGVYGRQSSQGWNSKRESVCVCMNVCWFIITLTGCCEDVMARRRRRRQRWCSSVKCQKCMHVLMVSCSAGSYSITYEDGNIISLVYWKGIVILSHYPVWACQSYQCYPYQIALTALWKHGF